MVSKSSRHKRIGFTLVEMLVVITIIAILASLVLVAARAAQKYVRQSTIITEMDNVSGSLQNYKLKYGAYPPNTVVNTPAQRAVILADLKRHFKQVSSKHQEPDSLFQALAGLPAAEANAGYRGMNASEAIVFWLGGFSDDVRYPVSGKGGPSYVVGDPQGEDLSARNWLHTFDQSRLGPRGTNGAFSGRVVTYADPAGQPRAINLWMYTPSSSNQPYAYFDTSRYKPVDYDPISNGLVALKTSSGGGGTQVKFVNDTSFQILHSGLDNSWGDFTPFSYRAIAANSGLLYPQGPFTEELADNLVSFSRATLEDSEP